MIDQQYMMAYRSYLLQMHQALFPKEHDELFGDPLRTEADINREFVRVTKRVLELAGTRRGFIYWFPEEI